MVEINGFSQIYYEGEKITYTIESLMNKEIDGYNKEFTWLSFIKDHGSITEKEIEVWDNPEFLIKEIYHEVLLPWVVDKQVLNPKEFTELLKVEGVALEDFEGLYELFNTADKLKMLEL